MATEIILTEYQDACLLAQYLDLLQSQGKVMVYSHIPQETFTKNWGTKMKNKRMGVHAGVPDYIVVSPTSILFLELKRKKGGNVKPEQKIWCSALDHKVTTAGIAKGFDAAKDMVDAFLSIDIREK